MALAVITPLRTCLDTVHPPPDPTLSLPAEPMARQAAQAAPSAACVPRQGLLRAATTRATLLPDDTDAGLWCSLLGEPGLDPTELHALTGLAEWRVVAQGQGLLQRGQQALGLTAVGHGEVALGLRTGDGTFRTERIVRGPAWLDQSAGWLGAPPALDALALGPVRLASISVARLSQALVLQPSLAQRLLRSLAREVQALTMNTHELMHKDAPARLAQWLHQRLEPADEGPAQAKVRLHDRKRDIASQLAITPETLSRLMRSFSEQGLIEVYGYTVQVMDTTGLQRLAQA